MLVILGFVGIWVARGPNSGDIYTGRGGYVTIVLLYISKCRNGCGRQSRTNEWGGMNEGGGASSLDEFRCFVSCPVHSGKLVPLTVSVR